MESTTPATLYQSLAARFRAAGLDLVQPFRVDTYNAVVDAPYRLPDFGRASTFGVLVGNTRTLWAHFAAAVRTAPGLLASEHPLDAYVARECTRALSATGVRHESRYAPEPPPRRVAMGRLAHVAGLAYLAPSHLCVHPTYGPWIALRCAAVFDLAAPDDAPPPARSPCADCHQRCAPALEHAVREGHWRAFLAARDACPVGREHRYTEAQLEYHYTKDRAALLTALAECGDARR